MSSIYIHIPFCKQACNYCNFYFSTSNYFQEDFTKAVLKEIAQQKNYLPSKNLKSVYFGGGTPSILPSNFLDEILMEISKHFNIENNAEITLEANPDDLDINKLTDLKQLGINRLSIGVQSFFDTDLAYMNRAHNANDVHKCLNNAEKLGFENLSIDLIYGVPSQSHKQWKENLILVNQYNINHLSSYALTIEEKTPLYFLIRKGKAKNVNDEQALADFTYLQEWANKNKWQHYEISNLCINENYSVHNTAYWKNEAYLGVGPAAHSYNGASRQWNVSNLKKYIEELAKDKLIFEKETLSIKEKYNEYVMTALRTIWGVDVNYLRNNFKDFESSFKNNLAKINPVWLNVEDEKISLSQQGMFYADGIAAEFFEV